jgi:hypothetical protein
LPIFQIYPREGFVGLKHLFCGTVGLTFPSEVHKNFLPILLQYYPAMITDPLYYTASGERSFGLDKVNIQQCIPSGWAIYYLSEPIFPYQTIHKCLSSTITNHISIPIYIR